MNDDLAVRVRNYARGPGRAAIATSSAWLARQLGVDPRTIAAALRPYGIRPAEIERGVRGYHTADLAGLVVDEPSDPGAAANAPAGGGAPASSRAAGAPSAVGLANAQAGARSERCPRCDGTRVESLTWTGGNSWRPEPCSACATALDRLSAGAGHDMTPALRAAGLL